MRVELLYADGDPAAMPARQNLVEVLNEDAFETPIQMIAIGYRGGRGTARHARLADDPDRRRRTSTPSGTARSDSRSVPTAMARSRPSR